MLKQLVQQVLQKHPGKDHEQSEHNPNKAKPLSPKHDKLVREWLKEGRSPKEILGIVGSKFKQGSDVYNSFDAFLSNPSNQSMFVPKKDDDFDWISDLTKPTENAPIVQRTEVSAKPTGNKAIDEMNKKLLGQSRFGDSHEKSLKENGWSFHGYNKDSGARVYKKDKDTGELSLDLDATGKWRLDLVENNKVDTDIDKWR